MLNRVEVLARAGAIAAAAHVDAPTAFLVVRTPRARDVELALGYEAGAALAAAMEAAITASVRAGDTVLRIGEYDFLVLLPGLHGRAHAALGAAKLVRTLQQPVPIDGRSVQPAVVVGIAVCPQDGDDAALLCRRADQASTDALATPERHAFWIAPALPLDILHDELRIAIADNQLQMFLQPIAALPGRTVLSYEALSRWTNPVLGVVPPDVFIGVAERGGLIGELTRWNLNIALRTLVALRQGGRPVRIAVNLSVEALQLPGFVDQVLDLLRLWRVPGDALELEITESALMRDVTGCSHLLGALRAEGVRIAIDDFGTGYSSLAYLRRLPVDSLKIDRSFIRDIVDDPRARHMVGSMIQLAHGLDLTVVAEGIEDDATLALLQAADCDFAQGYLIGRPTAADGIVAASR